MEAMKDYVAHLDNKKNYSQRSCLSVLQCKKNTEMAALFWNLRNWQCQSAFQPELWQIWIVQ